MLMFAALIHYPPGLTLPAPWQPNWQTSHALDLPSLPSLPEVSP
jgi:hypothetical protein